MGGEVIPLVAIVCAVGIPLMIPIVAILTAHQRKMAELYRQGGVAPVADPQTQIRLAQLESEVGRLRELVHEQTIALDSMRSLSAPPDVPQRKD
jgi:hypothetical protein